MNFPGTIPSTMEPQGKSHGEGSSVERGKCARYPGDKDPSHTQLLESPFWALTSSSVKSKNYSARIYTPQPVD